MVATQIPTNAVQAQAARSQRLCQQPSAAGEQRPAAADAIAAVADAERESAADVGTKSAIALNEEPGCLALAQAHVLERRPLIQAGGNQHLATDDIARPFHRRCEQSTALQRPLRH